MSDSSVDSSDSYNSDDARHFLREWRMAKDRYSEVTRENAQLETHLRVTEVTLHATEEETSAARARLAEADAMVAGEFHCFEEKPSFLSLNFIP
jgi:(p)ppGpp synthase/HD superfamily hydrolase